MHFSSLILCSLLLLAQGHAAAQEGAKLYLKAKGWYQFSRVMHSSDTLSARYDYNGNWFQRAGAQFTVLADVDAHLQGALGLGGYQTNTLQGSVKNITQTGFVFIPYITEARFTYFSGEREKSPFLIDAGFFPFQYNADTRNLGSYLLRGPVYPGILFSEFESQTLDGSVANILGTHAQVKHGMFTHDILVRSEIEFPPVSDLSLVYISTLKLGGAMEVSAGANFYRLFSMKPAATDLTDRKGFPINNPKDVVAEGETPHPYMGNYAHIDTVTGDTTLLSHRGIKVMGRLSLDPKPWLGIEGWGSQDLKIYGEAAIIGTKDYKGVYEDISERIPVMVGFGLPSFGFLDESVLEVEYYRAPFRDDYRRLMAEASPIPNSNKTYDPNRLPGSEYDVTNVTEDDWKWSLNLAKTFQQSLRLSLQIANDHFRPATHVNSNPAVAERLESALTTTKDWYWAFKLGYSLR